MPGESADVLVQEIDATLHELDKDKGAAACASHQTMCTGMKLLLRCEKARLQTEQKMIGAAGLGGGTAGTVAALVTWAVTKYFGQ